MNQSADTLFDYFRERLDLHTKTAKLNNEKKYSHQKPLLSNININKEDEVLNFDKIGILNYK